MTEALILSGKTVSHEVYNTLQSQIDSLKSSGCTPGLAVVLVGDDPASNVYVNSKARRFNKLGLFSETIRLPEDIGEDELLSKIQELNNDDRFHGILVQMPLPKHLNEAVIIEAVNPLKDVDGFHPENLGRLTAGRPRFVPCTPKGIMRILKHYNIDPSGKHVVVLGRSNIVGRPISILMSLKQTFSNATTTICHSGTADIPYHTLQADILIAAIGVPNFVTSSHIKEGAVIIDVGINRVEDDSEKGYRLVGDVYFDSVNEKVSAITPVPGGVGPMTIAMLVENTVEAAERLVSG
ncbi:MAG: bifunctional methylenetetrahydrofolate dehydrogenase/methenyltetrahydrofolate cyclohydrolase FolD [Candidatus Marinimicrobia bacterium]|nr:bifunctional methylenetetrahydrofolate dehydrogenase/methenyltetrahydrofolate cyclohydrolase FolD [Candidatus Neomarinimicrobiota bacterium]